MIIEIREYDASMAAALAEFNRRLRTSDGAPLLHGPGNSDEAASPCDSPICQKYYLAVDQHQVVRGGYILKRQDFWIGGQVTSLGHFGLPVSEGIVNHAYTPLGVRLLLDAIRRHPLLFGLGMGGYDERLPQLLHTAGWRMGSVPFFFRVVHPAPFLRNIVYLRRSALRRRLLDLLAASGMGWLGIKAVQAVQPACSGDASLIVDLVDRFDDWADDLWDACKIHYPVCAVRNRAALDILYPAARTEFIRLQFHQGGRPVGWAVLLDTQLASHRQFGNMRLGSIVDCFADPAHARTVISCARKTLESKGVDLIVSNQSHRAWCDALKAAGFLRGPSNFILGTSRGLTSLLESNGEGVAQDQIHINRGDGDGPINL